MGKVSKPIELLLAPAQADDAEVVRRLALERSGRKNGVIVPLQRSVDARKGQPRIRIVVEVRDVAPIPEPPLMSQTPANLKGTVLIVGAGPAGYFAALEFLMLGVKPIVLERGKDARARRYDLRAIMQESIVGEHSNYCFGEGGAGTYSDGKLYTRSDKRGDIARVLRLLVEHGARPEILVDSHPHIGSNKLPGVVEKLRESILQYGGEVHFDQHVTDLVLDKGQILGVLTPEKEWRADAVVLATGHSARDVFEMLHRRGVLIESKTFALGLRIEHPQALIDEIQYRQRPRDPHLPASSYRLVTQTDDAGVWSFCMCPGGLIVPAATAPGEMVVNGMSMSGRNSRYANSGIVTEVLDQDVEPFRELGPLAALELQRQIEKRAFAANGDGSQKAPAQRLVDFLAGKRGSGALPSTSYVPGLVEAHLGEVLGPRIERALIQGLTDFTRKMRGYLSEEAIVVGVESRTSSPVRIPRDAQTLEHPEVARFYPCGEGAGYAGGIVSAALDGQRVARACVKTHELRT